MYGDRGTIKQPQSFDRPAGTLRDFPDPTYSTPRSRLPVILKFHEVDGSRGTSVLRTDTSAMEYKSVAAKTVL